MVAYPFLSGSLKAGAKTKSEITDFGRFSRSFIHDSVLVYYYFIII